MFNPLIKSLILLLIFIIFWQAHTNDKIRNLLNISLQLIFVFLITNNFSCQHLFLPYILPLQSNIRMFVQFSSGHSKYDTAKWGGYEDDHSITGSRFHKSYTAYKSTVIDSKSPDKSMALSRLEDARRTIDQVIVDLTDKKDMNNQTLREAASVNSEIIEHFRKESPNESKVKLVKSPSNFSGNYKSANESLFENDSLILRERLKTELQNNSNILQRLTKMEAENDKLKRGFQLTFGAAGETDSLRKQNQSLKLQLSRVVVIPQEILNQVGQLKKQNQKLRVDTVRLIEKADRI